MGNRYKWTVPKKFKIRRDDTVQVMTGKDRGKRGKVLAIQTDTGRARVQGANIVKRHLKPGRQARQAGIVEQEAPIQISNLMLVCSKCDRPTRVGHRFLADGTKVRVCKKCDEQV
jgi:large subunit ribosomal protein L24